MADFSAAALLPLLARLKNDLEPVVAASFAEVAECLETLDAVSQDSFFAHGGKSSRMTGSGGCVFAPFENEKAAREAQRSLPDNIRGFIAKGLNQHPLLALSR